MSETQVWLTGIDMRHSARVLSAESRLEDLPLRPAVRAGRSCSLAEAVERMEQAGVSSLLVDGGGIVTEWDIARTLGHGLPLETTLEEIATWQPIVVPGETRIVDAAAVMLNEHVRHLLVSTPETAVVSLRDVTALLLQIAQPEVWLHALRLAVDSPSEIWLG